LPTESAQKKSQPLSSRNAKNDLKKRKGTSVSPHSSRQGLAEGQLQLRYAAAPAIPDAQNLSLNPVPERRKPADELDDAHPRTRRGEEPSTLILSALRRKSFSTLSFAQIASDEL
jgi:hypothetical protein